MTPLADTLGRLAAADPYCTPRAGVPDGDRWTRLQDVLDDPALLRTWFDGLGAESKGAPDVAASYLASWLGGIVLDPAAWALGSERRTWPLDPRTYWLHRHDDGWFDGFALGSPQLRVVPGDPAAGDADVTVVADVATLRGDLARDAVAVLAPLFVTIRTFAPYGIRGMWGAVADSLGASAVTAAFRAGAPERSRPAFDEAMRLVDDLSAAGAGRITRPLPASVTCAAGTTTVAHKGTCCLWYKTTDDTAPIGERYCLSCPLQPDPDQLDRWVAWLDEVDAARVVREGAGEEHSTS